MDENNRNFILAIVLSIGVLFAWQYYFVPKHPVPATQTTEQQQTEQQTEQGPPQPPGGGEVQSGGAPQPGPSAAPTMSREEALAQSPRVAIETPSVIGSIALKGGRIDDLTLKDYRETVEPTSPLVVLLSPAGGPHAYYAEHGWVAEGGKDLGLPGPDTLWTADSAGPLTPQSKVTLSYDTGKGLKFTRTISLDDKYMFTVADQVANTGAEAVTLYPYALVSRHETAPCRGLLHIARGPDRRGRQRARRDQLFQRGRGPGRPRSRATMAGSASPINIGRPSSSPSRARPSTPSSTARKAAIARASRPTISWGR